MNRYWWLTLLCLATGGTPARAEEPEIAPAARAVSALPAASLLNAQWNNDPQWSPDGKRLVVVRTTVDTARDDYATDLWVRSDGTWRACEQALRGAGGVLSGLRNAYSGEVQASAARCDAADPKTVGALVLEKARPSLVEPRPLAFSHLAPADLIRAPLKLRVSVCDRWGQVRRVADLDF